MKLLVLAVLFIYSSFSYAASPDVKAKSSSEAGFTIIYECTNSMDNESPEDVTVFAANNGRDLLFMMDGKKAFPLEFQYSKASKHYKKYAVTYDKSARNVTMMTSITASISTYEDEDNPFEKGQQTLVMTMTALDDTAVVSHFGCTLIK